MSESSLPTLLTITLSHYGEKARWGLDHAAIAYREERHAPGFHAFAVRRFGGRRMTPILATADGLVEDSTNILLWANEHAAPGRELYPAEPAARTEALALEDGFDEELGPHVRRAIYFGLLPQRALTSRLMTHEVPRHERLLFPLVYAPLRKLMRSSMRIDADGAARSLDQLQRSLEAVGKRLADGRRYLMGERFGAADITLASLLAPAVWAPGYGVPLPAIESLPDVTVQLIRTVRATPAGEFCLRLYADERRRVTAR